MPYRTLSGVLPEHAGHTNPASIWNSVFSPKLRPVSPLCHAYDDEPPTRPSRSQAPIEAQQAPKPRFKGTACHHPHLTLCTRSRVHGTLSWANRRARRSALPLRPDNPWTTPNCFSYWHWAVSALDVRLPTLGRSAASRPRVVFVLSTAQKPAAMARQCSLSFQRSTSLATEQ